MASLIPRTSIDEANRHLTALHRRVSELESTVKNQNEALHAKDEWLKKRIADIEETKNTEVSKLTEKITSSEKTVDILNEQLRQKHQQVAVLQRSCRLMQSLVSMKPHVKELFLSLDEAERDIQSQKDFLSLYAASTSPVRNPNTTPKSSGHYVNSAMLNHYANPIDSPDENSIDGDSGHGVWKVDPTRRTSQDEKKKGKEFYL